MTDSIGDRIAGFWAGLRKATSDLAARPGVSLIKGKAAAVDVIDDRGNLILAAGGIVDDAVLKRAAEAGAVPRLTASVLSAATQDLKERVRSEYERTPEGQDRRSLATSEEYIEARAYIKWIAAVEVTDIRGHILVAAGKEIDDEDVRLVREAGQLGALIYSAQQSGPPPLSVKVPPPVTEGGRVVRPPSRRTAQPLGGEDVES